MDASGDGVAPEALGRLREQRLQRERTGAGLPVDWDRFGAESTTIRAVLCLQRAMRVWMAKKVGAWPRQAGTDPEAG